MSRQQLVPLNAYASASAPTTPTIRTGDLYYNTTTGLMVYNGSSWVSVATSTLTNLDAGYFDSIYPYNGGLPSDTPTQYIDGGTP